MRYTIYNPETLEVLYITQDLDESPRDVILEEEIIDEETGETITPAVTEIIEFVKPENSIIYNGCSFIKPMINQYPNPTHLIEGLSAEEIVQHQMQMQLDSEYQLYHKRKDDGINAYLMISAELRLAKMEGLISDLEHTAIENVLEPARAEVVLGQWLGAKQKLIDAGSNIIGEVMYNDLMTRLENYIQNNY